MGADRNLAPLIRLVANGEFWLMGTWDSWAAVRADRTRGCCCLLPARATVAAGLANNHGEILGCSSRQLGRAWAAKAREIWSGRKPL